jgi:phytoene dehydrogenase-like protein
VSSPFFRALPLAEHGLEWVHSPACLAHPFDDGSRRAGALDEHGRHAGPRREAWRRLMAPWSDQWLTLAEDVLGPLEFPDHPFLLARFGLTAVRPAYGLAKGAFRGDRARALFAGNAAHSMVPLTQSPTAAFGLTLAAAGHAVGGRSRAADRAASPPRWRRTSARWAARSSPARRWTTWTSCAACGRFSWT